MSRALRWYDYITINIFFFALTVLSQTNGLVFPLLIQQFVGEEVKGTYLGRLRLWTLMIALLWQALMGMLSDRSTSRFGRRRPFIFAGTLGMTVTVVLVGLSAGMAGLAGFTFLFVIALLQSVAANTAHGAQQGLIPDLVPSEKRGRFSAVKAVLEVPIPLLLVSFTIARFIAAGSLWVALFLAIGVLLAAMLLTMLAPEQRLAQASPGVDWAPIARLAAMTALFTAMILGMGALVGQAGRLLAGDAGPAVILGVTGLSGLIAIVLTVAAGVWLSVRISVGAAAARANPSFTWWVINRLAFLVGTTNLSTFAVYFLQARLGLVREQAAGPAAQLMAVIGVFILVSALPSGWLGDRFGHRLLVGIAGLLAALGVVIVLLSPSLMVIYIGGGFIGIATGLFFTANWALGTELVPRGEAGRYLGISNLAGAGAGAVGAYIGGPIADFVTARLPNLPGAGYILLFGLYGLMFLVSILALRHVRLPDTQPAASWRLFKEFPGG
ncbi:MAG: Major Facilitator Superfamily protein [Chloroflexi bacterium ADurb.Bin325]|nr:MAG: Major Facilitator Superfamily protein [Chloroflexi bacterium ADurb.Bin325]